MKDEVKEVRGYSLFKFQSTRIGNFPAFELQFPPVNVGLKYAD